MYIFAYACACVCTSSVDRLRSYQPISFFENYSTRFSSKNPTLPPLSPPFLSTGSIRHLVFSTSLTTRENERIIGQGTRVRSHMAPRFFQTFHPIPPPPPLYSWKRKLPENCRSKSDRGPGKTFLFFFFFFFFSPFSILSINDIRKKKKKEESTSEIFSILSIEKSDEREFKKARTKNVTGEKVRSVGRAVTDFICSTLDGYESCTGIQVSIVYTSLTPRTRNPPTKIYYYNPDILSRYSVASMFVSKTRYVDYIAQVTLQTYSFFFIVYTYTYPSCIPTKHFSTP